jgi:peptidase E
MGKLYFMGGENVAKRDSKSVNVAAFQDAGNTPNVLVFSWARPSFDRTFRQRERLFNYFRNLGAESVNFSEYSDLPEQISAKVAHADLVYLTGGQTGVLAVRAKSKGLDRFLRIFSGVIVGRSAGAAVMGKRFLVTNRYSGQRKIANGFGMVDFSVKTHYQASQDVLLRRFFRNGKLYAVPHGSALIYDKKNGHLASVGEVFVFMNGEKTIFVETSKP